MSNLPSCCLDYMWAELIFRLRQHSNRVESRNGLTKEVLAYRGTLPPQAPNFLINKVRRASRAYAGAELLWYLSGTSDASMMTYYAPSYSKFLRGDNTADGAYGARWAAHDQLRMACEELNARPDSRRCVITCWEPRDVVTAARGDSKDLPCTLSIQFVIRNEIVTTMVTMRSNDAWLGMPYDVFCFSSIGRLVAAACGYRAAGYAHCVNSMHLYEKHWAKVDEALKANESDGSGHDDADRWLNPEADPRSYDDLTAAITLALTAEERYRLGRAARPEVNAVVELLNPLSILGKCLTWCADGVDERRAKLAQEVTS